MRLHLQKKIIFEVFILTHTGYFTVKPGQKIYLAPVIAMNFVCQKFFLYFSNLSRGGPDLLNPPLVTPAPIVPTRATTKVRNLNA